MSLIDESKIFSVFDNSSLRLKSIITHQSENYIFEFEVISNLTLVKHDPLKRVPSLWRKNFDSTVFWSIPYDMTTVYRAGNTIFKVGGPKHNIFLDVIIFLLKR